MAKESTRKTRYQGIGRRSDGRLVVRVVIRDAGGHSRNRTRTLGPNATIDDAKLARDTLTTSMIAELSGRPIAELADATISIVAYSEQWLKGKAGRSTRATNLRYATDLAHHILPRIEHLRVSEINRAVVESWVAHAERARKANGEPYGRDTVKGWWRILVSFLRDMSADHGLADPTTRVRPPRIQQERGVRRRETLSTDQMQRFLDEARQRFPIRYAEIMTLAQTGLRPGELYAMRWEDVDLVTAVAVVRRAISAGTVVETTKTKNARSVPLTPDVVGALQQRREEWIRLHPDRFPTGLIWSTSRARTRYDKETGDVVSHSPAGSPRIPESLRKPLAACSKAIGLDWVVGPQVLRRTVNTALREGGVPDQVVRQILGHVSESQGYRYMGENTETQAKAMLRIVPGGGVEDGASR